MLAINTPERQKFKICSLCKDWILEGEIVTAVATGKSYHKHHYKCSFCHMELSGHSCYDLKDKLYCVLCFNKSQSTSVNMCAMCDQKIVGKCIEVFDSKYHPEHFQCSICYLKLDHHYKVKRTLSGPTCQDCYKKYKPRCANCFLFITKNFYIAFNRMWHIDCFKCKVCELKVDCNEFIGNENWPCHKDCYIAKFARKCYYCKKVIEGQF